VSGGLESWRSQDNAKTFDFGDQGTNI
jgi:hypothetical protein